MEIAFPDMTRSYGQLWFCKDHSFSNTVAILPNFHSC